MVTVLPAGSMAPAGQTPRQRVQPVMPLRAWAQRSASKST